MLTVESREYTSSLGRLLLILMLLLGSGFLAVVLRRQASPDAGPQEHSVADRRRTMPQTIAYLLAVGFPILLALCAGLGYLYTAALLTTKLVQTIWLAIVLLVLHGLAMRWLYHARGRLALERIRAAQPAPETVATAPAAVAAGSRAPEDSARMAVFPAVQPETDMATINVQTRRLLKLAISAFALVGAWIIWGDVIPSLKFLDFQLWTSHIETTQMVPGPDGTEVPRNVIDVRVFTLGHALTALAVLLLALVAARNIPGVLEVTVLQRLPIDSGARYATTAVVRYLIYIVGVVTAFNLMGIGWDKVQWLVAALGVGLGFGLQEIVANWVSGIILLFERPLRVGDVVTVGDVTGVVTRIHIRATTIRNWDRKEFIVPNRELVTGKLLNWTLTDDINRLVINVGVAYGTDTKRVGELLHEIVGAHDNVADDPAPIVTLEEFGDSTLNFVVRCYLPSLDNRLATLHDLHSAIHQRFGDENIEIAFPQLDLHLRSGATGSNPAAPAPDSGHAPAGNGADGKSLTQPDDAEAPAS